MNNTDEFKCETLELARELVKPWTRDDYDKAFKQAFVMFPPNHPNCWDIIATLIPSLWPPLYMQHRFENLRYDQFIAELSDSYPIPPSMQPQPQPQPPLVPTMSSTSEEEQQQRPPNSSSSSSKKRTHWTEDEHRSFLRGLVQYGRGDWISISNNLLPSKTPCQIASHAQKYFLRQGATKKRRKSIHDITTQESYKAVVPPRQVDTQNCLLNPYDVVMQQQQQSQDSDIAKQQQQGQAQPMADLGDDVQDLIWKELQQQQQQQQSQDSDIAEQQQQGQAQPMQQGNIGSPLPHDDWELTPSDDAAQQQQGLQQEQTQPMSDPNPSTNLSQHMDGFGFGIISDIAIEESQLMNCHGSLALLSNSDLDNLIDFSC
ncbi:hypothetical protein RIF29_18474 [Crotalaria pallida]|uniref:Uncharacterized protein n=1 Tax=Crotalaria pallida TaxID=3830 RepID=A0AAN9FSQ8_CROPI